jgi:hypothetical protein
VRQHLAFGQRPAIRAPRWLLGMLVARASDHVVAVGEEAQLIQRPSAGGCSRGPRSEKERINRPAKWLSVMRCLEVLGKSTTSAPGAKQVSALRQGMEAVRQMSASRLACSGATGLSVL